MPHPLAFLKAYNLNKNVFLGSSTKILKVNIKHIVAEQYKHYLFPITIEVQTAKHLTEEDIKSEFETFVKSSHVVNSQYNNPYLCSIDDVQVHKKTALLTHYKYYTITCRGNAVRIPKKV
jgi:hypothetical protein